MIRPRSPHHIESVAHHFLADERPDGMPQLRCSFSRRPSAPPRRQREPLRIATLALTEAAGRLAQQVARAAGDWSALGGLADALEMAASSPARDPLDALVCCLALPDEVSPGIIARVAHFLGGCRAHRVILLVALPARTDGPAALRRTTEPAEAFEAGLGLPVSALCVRQDDLRGDAVRAAAVFGSIRVAVLRICARAPRRPSPCTRTGG